MKMYSLKSEVNFDSLKKAESFFESIKPEFSKKFKRSKSNLKCIKKKVFFEATADDKSAMRATLNSFYKPLKLFKELEEIN